MALVRSLLQALAVAMYIFGFREGWTWIFPQHPAIVVDLATFGVIFVIALLSTSLAFKIQYLVIVVIAASLFVVFGNRASWSVSGDINWWGGLRRLTREQLQRDEFLAGVRDLLSRRHRGHGWCQHVW